MLLYGDGIFIQVLEGPDENVDKLCEKIAEDPRHSAFEVLYTETIDERAFGDWSMAYKVLTPDLAEKTGGSYTVTQKNDLVSFLREGDHFVKRFMAECVKDIGDVVPSLSSPQATP